MPRPARYSFSKWRNCGIQPTFPSARVRAQCRQNPSSAPTRPRQKSTRPSRPRSCATRRRRCRECLREIPRRSNRRRRFFASRPRPRGCACRQFQSAKILVTTNKSPRRESRRRARAGSSRGQSQKTAGRARCKILRRPPNLLPTPVQHKRPPDRQRARSCALPAIHYGESSSRAKRVQRVRRQYVFRLSSVVPKWNRSGSCAQ